MAKLTDAEKQKIVSLIDEGKTRNAIVKDTGRSAGSVTSVAKEFDRSFDRSATKIATEVKAAWDQSRRVALVGKGMEHAEKLLLTIADARELQSWMVAVGTGIDKLRLENNEPTNIAESRRGGLDLESEFRKLDAEIRTEP